jgi:hypothetical protein
VIQIRPPRPHRRNYDEAIAEFIGVLDFTLAPLRRFVGSGAPRYEPATSPTREADMNLTDLLLPTYRNMLRTLRGLIDKAEAQLGGSGAEALLRARLAPDMFPLATQIRFACVQAREAPLRLLGASLEPIDELLNEGRNGGEQPGTLGSARARIDEALAFLDSLGPDALDQAPPHDPLVLTLPMGLTFDLTRDQFARDWALGQFYFHIMAAYAILRKEGVEIGKADYVPHMFAYLRKPASPPAQA